MGRPLRLHPDRSASLHPDLSSVNRTMRVLVPDPGQLLPVPPRCLTRHHLGEHLRALNAILGVNRALGFKAPAVRDECLQVTDAILAPKSGQFRARTRAPADNLATGHSPH